MRFTTFLEALDSKIEFKVPPHLNSPNRFCAVAEIDEREIYLKAERDIPEDNIWDFTFADGFDLHKTGNGSEFKVFSAVRQTLNAFIEEIKPTEIHFSADTREENRPDLYERLIKKYNHPAYELSRDDQLSREYIHFTLKRKL